MLYVIVLHEAHELADRMRKRLRFLTKRDDFPPAVVARREKAAMGGNRHGGRP
jgi:hypothetical protein